MKKLIIVAHLLVFGIALKAQSDYFVFIQSDNNQPFYVQTDGKTLSSSSIGHLIISGLKDTVYSLNIGFPKNQYPEQSFQLRINKKDAGYQLKNMGGEGWALFNLQTLQLIKSQQSETKKTSISYGDIKRTDVFSTLMAGLVNDSAVLYTSIAKVEPIKEKTIISDSQPLPNEVVGRPQTPKVDTPAATIVATNKDEDTSNAAKDIAAGIPKKDTSLTNVESAPVDTVRAQVKANDVVGKPLSNVDSAITSAPASKSIDTARTKEQAIVQKPPVEDSKPVADTIAREQNPVVTLTPAKPKLLIVALSETKTAAGTELVFYDMSVPDNIDTIKLLIPNELASSEPKPELEKKATVEDQSGTEKKGNFFGRLFGKKEKSKVNKDAESSITVTTVPQKKPETEVQQQKNPASETATAPDVKDNTTKDTGKKEQSEGFFGKLFSKKEKASADTAKAEKAKKSTIKVSNVEAKKQPDTSSTRKVTVANPGDPEVERLKKAQDQDEKTGTERFFGKVFRKKNKVAEPSTPTRDGTSSSIKVTTVEPAASANDKEAVVNGVTNSDCRQFASNDDADKLRVRMLVEKDPDAQIVEARKTFRSRCFTTEQIKSLSTLFRTDEGKYKLFDAAYPFVSDSRNFKTLVSVLTDQYYINRFKAMVRM